MDYDLASIGEYAVESARIGTGSVLVVDDEQMIADIFGDWIEEAGHDPTVVYKARDGLMEIDSSVDVVVLDRGMAIINGDEFLEIIRSEDIAKIDSSALANGDLDEEYRAKEISDLRIQTARKLDAETVEHIQKVDIDCPVCIVSAVDPDFDLLDMDFQNYITKGAKEAEVVRAIEVLLGFEELPDPLKEYWIKGRKRDVIKDELSRRELRNHDGYQALLERMETIEMNHQDLFEDIS